MDFDTLKDNSVTLRDLFSTKQVRLPLAEVAGVISNLSTGLTKWEKIVETYGLFEAGKDE